ncbi:class I SAM-dependent methyltransferase [Sphingomonas sp. QA11]|uniref:class I SAM-dependent methyltransferase n=1 Tax=Sphingomonas sp. QA11 TaxID=2950605 RepID=UPI0023498D24|nr:class I SAM-dependent methyltransferase [Sphingomonas sp. QA11]WCM28047.1 class I SAM-dependent methyltransferase [Sphingomonas sp. QA11]
MRSTDTDWAAIGEVEPYFGVLSSVDYLRDNLTAHTRDQFFASGEADMASVIAHIRDRYDPDFHPRHAIDFGCGVGRLALAMAKVADRVTGVDISPGMLVEASRNGEARGAGNVTFAENLLVAGDADWVNSFLVFQHIPPERGFALMGQLFGQLRPGGVASIHLTAYRTNDHLPPSLEDVRYSRFDGRQLEVMAATEIMPAGRMRMYDYDMTRALQIFVDAALGDLSLEHFDHAGHHAFRVYGRKAG